MEEDVGNFIVRIDLLIGKGAFGKIFKCFKKGFPQQEYCAKYINKMQNCSDTSTRNKIVEAEKNAFKTFCQIKNENLVQFYEMIEQKDHLIIIMELCNYDLEKEFLIQTRHGNWFTQLEQIQIIKQILNGAKALFDNNIIHRDIKPQNILVKKIRVGNIYKKVYKISDFGFCKRLENLYKLDNLTRVGTITHVAPEIVISTSFNGKCDIYSYGILFYQIINQGNLPYYSFQSEVYNFYKTIKASPFKFPTPVQGQYGPMLMQLIESMIVFNIEKRISFERIFSHEIFTETYQIFEESLFMITKDEQPIIENNQYRINQSNTQKKELRVQRIYRIQEIFYRKFQLCKHVLEYLEEYIIFENFNIFALQLLICEIGLKQITFAFAACHKSWCDIHEVFKNGSNDIIKLLKVFQEYCDKSKNDQKYSTQLKKIKSAYYSFNQHRIQKFDQFLSQIYQGQASQQFKNTIFQTLTTQRVGVNDLCEELQIRINQIQEEGWFSKLSSTIQENIQKICEIEKKQFSILNYQLIELDEIIRI